MIAILMILVAGTAHAKGTAWDAYVDPSIGAIASSTDLASPVESQLGLQGRARLRFQGDLFSGFDFTGKVMTNRAFGQGPFEGSIGVIAGGSPREDLRFWGGFDLLNVLLPRPEGEELRVRSHQAVRVGFDMETAHDRYLSLELIYRTYETDLPEVTLSDRTLGIAVSYAFPFLIRERTAEKRY